MIIGISGKIGSGKDTIGKIIQYLTMKSINVPNLQTFDDFCKNYDRYVNVVAGYNHWQIKKFAYKLKQIVSLLTGISVEDLEKQEVKDSLLSEEWIRYGYANGFIQKNGQTIMNNEACSKERYEQELKTNWQTAYKYQYTVRDLLQLIGTEAMRNVIHHNIWVNALFADYKLSKGKYDNVAIQDSYPYWLITDVRFPNEAEAIKERGGILIRVNRGRMSMVEMANQHPSETALDNYDKWNYKIDNSGTMEQLIEMVQMILQKEHLIWEK